MKRTETILCTLGALISATFLLLSVSSIPESVQTTNLVGALVGALSASFFAATTAICIAAVKFQKLFLFKAIFENANDAIAIIEKNGKYIWQNNANSKLFGFSERELIKTKAGFL